MNLTHEYNEYVVGYVVTDEDTGREINAQFQEYQHGYGDYAARIDVACAGDESHEGWSEEEQAEVVAYLNEQPEVLKLESAISALYEARGYYAMTEMGTPTEDAIFEAAKAEGWEPDGE